MISLYDTLFGLAFWNGDKVLLADSSVSSGQQ